MSDANILPPNANGENLLSLLKSKLGSQILAAEMSLGDAVIRISRQGMLSFFRLLKLDTELQFNLFINVTAVDYLDSRDPRFELVYHLFSLPKGYRLRVKIDVPEEDTTADSVTALWSGANFMEREVWDMYGISFRDHPDQRRILMYDEFVGHPLRKDYPVQGKQPRIPMRHPEVRNTALDMTRPALVQIRKRSANEGRA